MDIFGACVCDLFWIGDDCSNNIDYRGICDSHCMGCVGPYSVDCISCVPNSTRDEFGKCVCDPYWIGEDCSIAVSFSGTCHPICVGCNGPSSSNCIACRPNAMMDAFGNCVCHENWVGEDCRIYLGICVDICDGCVGSTNSHCVRCRGNADWNDFGACVC